MHQRNYLSTCNDDQIVRHIYCIFYNEMHVLICMFCKSHSKITKMVFRIFYFLISIPNEITVGNLLGQYSLPYTKMLIQKSIENTKLLLTLFFRLFCSSAIPWRNIGLSRRWITIQTIFAKLWANSKSHL